MSLLGLIRRRGLTATVFRSTTTRSADKATKKSWVSQPLPVRGFVDSMTAERVTRLFGDGVTADVVLLVSLTVDVRDADGLTFTSGPLAGQRFTIAKRTTTTGRARSDHAALALTSTTETFSA